jgi:phosphohistidine swiveling domain-containing protein
MIIQSTKPAAASMVGTKARNLQILSAQFRVPEFFVIPADYYAEFSKNGKIPVQLENDLPSRLSSWLASGLVAVRSSAVAEDLPGLSFAGMYETVLSAADFDAVLSAIKKVWASNDSERVKAYRRQHGIEAGPMAVIIQRQLLPETSGVIVTRSPIIGNEIVIECGTGLGDALVSGKIEPVRYRVRKDQVIQPDKPGLLSDQQVRELADTGRVIEELFGSAQDIEWAYEKNRLFILQARPLTVHGGVPRRHCTVWSNVNLRETIPDPITPMGWSLFTDFIFYAIVHDVFTIPVTEAEYNKYPMVERLLGRIYWNLNNCIAYGKSVGRIISLFKLSSLDPQLGDAAQAVDIKNLPQPIPTAKLAFWGPLALFRLTRYMLRGFTNHRSINRRVRLHYEESAQWLSRLEIADDPKKGLANIHEWLRVWFYRYGQEYFGSIFIGLFQMIILMKLMKWRMGQKGEVLSRNAIIGILDKTGEMAVLIQGLGARARSGIHRSDIRREDLRSLLKSDPEFKKAYHAFLDEFGHRGPGEFDFGKPNWRDDENMTLDVIRAATEARPYAVDRTAEMQKIERDLKPLALFFFRLFRPRLESLTPLREDGKHHFFKFGRRVKDQVFILENALIKQGYLKNKFDIFQLTLPDLRRIIDRQLSAEECRQLIAMRKQEEQENATIQPPDILYESGERIMAPLGSGTDHAAEPLTFGRIRARCRVIANFAQAPELKKGEILVTHHSDPGWTPLFMVASGVIVEVGGLICHAAMVARELGIPAVVLKNATRLIPDGAEVELDADRGRVTIISKK